MGTGTTTGGRVLVVDDHELVREMLREQLTRRGYAVVLAASGREALALARACPPTAVVSDMAMPELSGLALLRALRHDPRTKAVPFILFTADRYAALAQAAREAGALACLPKPDDLERLFALLAEVVPPAAATQRAPTSGGPPGG